MLILFHRPYRNKDKHFKAVAWNWKFGFEVNKLVDGSGYDRMYGRGDYRNVWGVIFYLGFWEWQPVAIFPFVRRREWLDSRKKIAEDFARQRETWDKLS